MPLTSNYVKYETDDAKEIIINIKYENDNDTRLSDGGFTASSIIDTGCKVVTRKDRIKPRELFRRKDNKAERVVFRTHTDWVNYIKDNYEDIIEANGESLRCSVLYILYN